MVRPYEIFNKLDDHGDYPENNISEREKSEIDLAITDDKNIQGYIRLLENENRPYARFLILQYLKKYVYKHREAEFNDDQIETLLKLYWNESNQWISEEFYNLLDIIGRNNEIMRTAEKAPFEVTRNIVALKLVDKLHKSKYYGKYDSALEALLRNIILNDPSNYVRNTIVKNVLKIEFECSPEFTQFCRQWYYRAAETKGITVNNWPSEPKVMGFFGDQEDKVFAPFDQDDTSISQEQSSNDETIAYYENSSNKGSTRTGSQYKVIKPYYKFGLLSHPKTKYYIKDGNAYINNAGWSSTDNESISLDGATASCVNRGLIKNIFNLADIRIDNGSKHIIFKNVRGAQKIVDYINTLN